MIVIECAYKTEKLGTVRYIIFKFKLNFLLRDDEKNDRDSKYRHTELLNNLYKREYTYAFTF